MTGRFISGAACLLLACQGQIIEPGGGGGGRGGLLGEDPLNPDRPVVGPQCETLDPGDAPIRRLSNAEYQHTINDLLNNPTLAETVSSKFPPETESLGFRNNAKFLQIGAVQAKLFMDAAEELAKAAASDASLLPCSPASGAERDCATQFIEEFGLKAYRRPLSPEEVSAYQAIYDKARATYSFEAGIEWITFTMLQSPHFLNRIELASPLPSGAAYTRPTAYEMASRLSYLIWQSMPDAELFDAAAQGKLGSAGEVAAQARRMLADPKAKRVYQFFEEWLDLDRLPTIERNTSVFPEYLPNSPALFAEETKTFIEHVLWKQNGDFQMLMTAPFSFLNSDLAQHYGVSGPAGSTFEQVSMPGRAGIMTQAGVLTVHDKPTRTSIVLRGLKVRTDFLCQTVGAPPADIVVDLPEITAGISQKERLAQHREDDLCASCHNKMDPLGLVFENFDALGKTRTVDELGNLIETAGEITYTRQSDGPVADATELAAALAASPEVRDCFTTQTFRFFYGRSEGKADACSLSQLSDAFEKSNHSISELLVALTQTDAFLYRRPNTGGTP
jgi:hypothetical protein